ncbi:transposase [Trichonephila clavipes]|nr:transposase [Trichonephila clavipes]
MFLKGFMIFAEFPNNDKLKIKKVSSKAEINSLYYQHNILEPIFEEQILPLYGKDIDKVELHMDKVSSHTSKSTAAYLPKKESEIGIKCIPFDEIRVKSP